MLEIEITGRIEASSMAISAEEIQDAFNEWLKTNVCNYKGSVTVTEKPLKKS